MDSITAQSQSQGKATTDRSGKALKLAVAGVIVSVLFIICETSPKPFGFTVGRPLPRGKVIPQLCRAGNVAVLLAPDGSLWSWKATTNGAKTSLAEKPTDTPQRIGSADDWYRVAAKWNHALALKTNGTLWAWGSTGLREGRVTTPIPVGTDSNWTQIAVGVSHSLALKSDGSLWGWGQNDEGQVGDGGTQYQFKPTQIGRDRDWSVITAGDASSFALKKNSTLWGWGNLTQGAADLSPRQIDRSGNIVAISANDFILLALRSDHTLWICGGNSRTTAPAYVKAPTSVLTQIGADKDWQEVYAGARFFMARKINGSWWVCGDFNNGENLAPKDALKRLPLSFEAWSLAPGFGDACLLTTDGALWTLSIQRETNRFTEILMKFERAVNQRLRALPGHLHPFKTRKFSIDPTPRKQWQWQPEEAG